MKATRRQFLGAVSGGAALVGVAKVPTSPVIGFRKDILTGLDDLIVIIIDSEGNEISRAPIGPWVSESSFAYNAEPINFGVFSEKEIDIVQFEVITSQGRILVKDYLSSRKKWSPGDANPQFPAKCLTVSFA